MHIDGLPKREDAVERQRPIFEALMQPTSTPRRSLQPLGYMPVQQCQSFIP